MPEDKEFFLIFIRGMLDVSGELIDNAELESMIGTRNLDEGWAKVEDLRL